MLSVDHQCKGRGLYSSCRHRCVIEAAHRTGDVVSYIPVSSASATGGLIQVVVLFPAFKVLESFLDCRICLGTDPKTFQWLAAVCHLDYPSGNAFTFSTSIGGNDQRLNILSSP